MFNKTTVLGATMAGFEDYQLSARAIEQELVRKGIALGLDWTDEVAVRALAREAMRHLARDLDLVRRSRVDRATRIKVDLFGLAGLMLKTMEESAGEGIESHGGLAWKAFARALWAERTPGQL